MDWLDVEMFRDQFQKLLKKHIKRKCWLLCWLPKNTKPRWNWKTLVKTMGADVLKIAVMPKSKQDV